MNVNCLYFHDLHVETDEFQIVPEQSTSAIIVHHPEAKYFNIKDAASQKGINDGERLVDNKQENAK